MTKILFSFSVPSLRLLLSSFAANVPAPSFFPLLPFPSPPSPFRCPSSSFPLPLHGRSFHLHPFLTGNPSFSSSSPTSPPYPANPSPLISPSPSQWHAPSPPLFVGNPSLPLPFLLIPFSSSSSSYSKPVHKPSPSMVAPSISALFLADDVFFPSPSSSPPLLLLHSYLSPLLLPSPPPIPSMKLSTSLSPSTPTSAIPPSLFTATPSTFVSLLPTIPLPSSLSPSPPCCHSPSYFTLPLHGRSLHLYPFLANDPSIFSSSPSPTPPPPIPPFSSSSSSSNSIHKVFYAALPLHNDSLLHLFLAGDPSYMSERHFHPLKL